MKKQYQSPALKVVEIKVEKGFQASGFSAVSNGSGTDFEMAFGDNGPCNEAYTFDDGNTFWN